MKPDVTHLCPKFERAMAVLSKPWNGLLMATLERGPARFTALGLALEALGDRMLALRLKELEANGLVERRVDPGPPVRVEYALTASGHGFSAVAAAIQKWGEQFEEPPRPLKPARKAVARTVRAPRKAASARRAQG